MPSAPAEAESKDRLPAFALKALQQTTEALEAGQIGKAIEVMRAFKAELQDGEKYCSHVPINLGFEARYH